MEPAKPYEPKEVEAEIYQRWLDSGYFNPDELPGERQKTFVIMLPPPNVTGSLHMGHALNACIQDALIRFERMRGKLTLWMPGTDHAGIATQNVVEKQLAKEGLSRQALGREKFLEKVWEWKEKYGNVILDQLKKLGASADWSRTRFTMDENYVKAVNRAFVHYYEKGLIYRDFRTVNWCVRCATSLSDLELEYEDEKAKLYYIKYGPLVIATVRPETKLGDTAVAVHPKDKRYKKYVGKDLTIDSVEGKITIKVVADEAVDPKFGTGVVKVTPAHDATDFEIAKRHGLPMRQVIDSRGRMNELAGKYKGLKVLEAREAILKDMREKDLIVKIEEYPHRVSKCSRCGTVIEPLPSRQWFVKMKELAKASVKSVKNGKVKFHPKRWEKVYFDWLENIRDWNISRQIWWGHRLPIWFCKTKSEEIKDANSEIKEGDYFVASEEKPKFCKICRRCDMEQSEDVLDTWFSSALWPFATLGWPAEDEDLKKFYPTQVLSTARDIINLWVARMIYSGLEFTKKEPFRDVIIHATVLNKEGKRMSKSLGTGADPMDFIQKYGADATRFGMLYQYLGTQDIKFGEESLAAGRKFANKIWNANRFVLMNMKKMPDSTKIKFTASDKAALKKLSALCKETTTNLEKYKFGQAIQGLYHFFWHYYADKIIEGLKPKLDLADGTIEKETAKALLLEFHTTLIKLLHPFMPFVTEAIYDKLPLESKTLLMVESWPK